MSDSNNSMLSPELGPRGGQFDSDFSFFSNPSLPMHPYFPQAVEDGPYAPSPLVTKTIVPTAAVNKLTAPLSHYKQMNPAQKKRKADMHRQLAARKKVALEKLPILTEENTTLKEEVAQLKTQIYSYSSA